MNFSYSKRCAIIVETAKLLRSHGSWCGETHLQKALYILQDLSKSSFGYKFVIYKHGPYSFDLNNELAAMRASNILELKFLKDGYGPSFVPTPFGERVLETNREDITGLEPIIEFLSDWFGASDVRHLEKVATAYYVTKEKPRAPVLVRAQRLNSLKPHVDIQSAEEAIKIVDEKLAIARNKLSLLAA
jgi:hypothetical protein